MDKTTRLRGSLHPGTAWHDTTEHNKTWCDMTCHDMTGYDTAWCGMARVSTAHHDMSQHSMKGYEKTQCYITYSTYIPHTALTRRLIFILKVELISEIIRKASDTDAKDIIWSVVDYIAAITDTGTDITVERPPLPPPPPPPLLPQPFLTAHWPLQLLVSLTDTK